MANPAGNQPTPPSSSTSPDGQQSFRVVRKRHRVPLSCAPCRHRKLKCNRASPCDNCTKRGDTASCSYATPGNRRKSGAGGANGTPDDMQNRIDRLEGLVLSLMTAGSQQPGTAAAAHAVIDSSRSNSLSTASDARLDAIASNSMESMEEERDGAGEESEVDNLSREIGVMKMDGQKTVFASDAHWYAILSEIGEVKKYFESHKEDYRQHMVKVAAAKADENPGAAFLLSGPPAQSRAEILAAFPSKADSDRLIARYFNAYDPSVHIVHGPSFQKQYDQHWLKPGETQMMWIGMCFAMMTLALQSYHRASDEPPEYRGRSLELSHDYRRLTAQCLLLEDITQPMSLTLETLVLHLQAEYGRSRDAEPGVLLMCSLCVRLAMRMGYHRDPGPHPGISPFRGEIRRRVWTFVRQCDLLISFQFGLPSMIRTDHVDTATPRNLYDDELYEEMQSLPPSRPTFEATPMSYMIAKSKMTFLFGKIVERTQSISNPPTYEETLRFDAELRELRSQHPPLLQMRSFPESARDPANLIMQRLGLELIFLRSLFVLHRRFIAQGRENPRYGYSRRTCIDASLELLDHQATLSRESEPGGRLRTVKWHISSLTTHDFLLAAMLVLVDLYKSTSSTSPDLQDPYGEEKREQMMEAVEHCITIWEKIKDSSMEAYKASVALRVTVEKLRAHRERRKMMPQYPTPPQSHATGFQSRQLNYGMFPNGAVNVGDVNTDDLPPEQSAAMTLGMLSSGGLTPGFGAGLSLPAEKPSYPANMAALLNEPMSDRSGLTPQYSGPDGAGMGMPTAVTGGASPLSQMFGQNNAFVGLDAAGGDIDWGAWDSYIQGNNATNMDATQMWPMNLDFSMDGGGQPPPPPQQQNGSLHDGSGGGGAGGSSAGEMYMGGDHAAGGPGGVTSM